jgi:hypothetical protein
MPTPASPSLPPLPYAEWKEAKLTLHLFLQIAGKVRMVLSPPVNHWWHVPFYVSARGLTTGYVPAGDGAVEMEFDLLGHELLVRTSGGAVERVALPGASVSDVHAGLFAALARHGVHPHILARPYDQAFRTPFAEDRAHAAYDPAAVARFHAALVWLDGVLSEFRSRFIGKCSPVHVFWHSLDIAVTRFSGRRAPAPPDAGPVEREAYSHEVISAGFWAGDDKVPAAHVYTYAHPAPAGLDQEPLAPAAARWADRGDGVPMALLAWDALRADARPREALLGFLESAYRGAANRARWPVDELERSHAR